MFVEPLEEAAMTNSGSMRILGTSAAQFIREGPGKSPMRIFQETLGGFLNVGADNVSLSKFLMLGT